MKDIMGHIGLNVNCRAEGPHANGKHPCDGYNCTCPCHVPGDWDGWRLGKFRGRWLALRGEVGF